MTGSWPRAVLAPATVLLLLAAASGEIRSLLPGSISWKGAWPTSGMSSEEAYRLVAQPTDPPGISVADALTLQHRHDATFLDARSADEYKAGHIVDARSLPFYEMDAHQTEALEGLTADSPIVVYCEGVGCELSLFLARELQSRGYKNLRIFYGGYPEWKQAGLPVAAS